MKIKSAEFVISNTNYKLCPKEALAEYAFIGRSNVGKSSLINGLVDRKNLAKTSGKPGKTQLINHFKINNNVMLAVTFSVLYIAIYLYSSQLLADNKSATHVMLCDMS